MYFIRQSELARVRIMISAKMIVFIIFSAKIQDFKRTKNADSGQQN